MAMQQGDIYWMNAGEVDELASDLPHPYVILQVQDDRAPATALVCALTSNLKRISIAGNVLLEQGEANLPKLSVVEVHKSAMVRQAQLGAYIGTLSAQRITQIEAGRQFVQTAFLRDTTGGGEA